MCSINHNDMGPCHIFPCLFIFLGISLTLAHNHPETNDVYWKHQSTNETYQDGLFTHMCAIVGVHVCKYSSIWIIFANIQSDIGKT